MTILVRMLCYLIIVMLIGYSLIRYYHLWMRNRIPNFCYFVLQIPLLAILIICQRRVTLITNDTLLKVFQVSSAIYLSIMLYTPVCCFVRGIIRFVGKHRKHQGPVYRFFNHPARSIYCILGLTALIGIFSIFQMKHLTVTEYTINTEKEASVENLKIALISDIHFGSALSKNELLHLIEKTNALEPDLVVLCGDLVDNNTTPELKKYCAECIKTFEAKYGIFYIEGNQEARIKNYDSLFPDGRIQLLKDQTIFLSNGIQLTGLRDSSVKNKIPAEYVMQGQDPAKPSIVVSHRPVELEKIAGLGADVALCGHTMGGQYPLGFIPVRIVNDMVYGEKSFGNMKAITTSGAGGYGIPAKFTSKSEIALIHLHFKPESES